MGGPRAGVSVEMFRWFSSSSQGKKKKVFPMELVFLHCIMEPKPEPLVKIKPGNV